MNVLVVGAGPAGVYFAYLAKRAHPDWRIRVVEQNPADAVFGFGLVFSDKALEFLRADDPGTYDLITPQMESWVDLTVVHRGERVVIDGIGFSAIGRLHLLRLLRQQLATVGIEPEYERTVADYAGYDLVVGADGANSAVRQSTDFGTRISHCANRFAWYGTRRAFATLTQTFVENEHGRFNAHHYRHAPDMSTFVAECDPQTWERAGFAGMDEARTMAYLERVFADTLQGEPLVTNRSIWRNFPNLRNDRWSAGNRVLIGDAQRTAHFSIGSGTRLAMEDAIALNKALNENPDVPAALHAFEASRRPIVEKLVTAADSSGAWYDRFAEHMNLSPRDFAWSYIQRSGRIDPGRLAKISPRFATT
ncbi:MAG TPA: FAD-dependent monooxygenase [Burkholderiales bacterium]|nr:FAD-dependent monooxygenase [Burkholderiales bacterium]